MFVLLFIVVSMLFFESLGDRPCPLIWIPVASATEGEAPSSCLEELGTLGVAMYLVVTALSYGASRIFVKSIRILEKML